MQQFQYLALLGDTNERTHQIIELTRQHAIQSSRGHFQEVKIYKCGSGDMVLILITFVVKKLLFMPIRKVIEMTSQHELVYLVNMFRGNIKDTKIFC